MGIIYDVHTTSVLEEKSVSPLRMARSVKADQQVVDETNNNSLITTLCPARNGLCIVIDIIIPLEKSA